MHMYRFRFPEGASNVPIWLDEVQCRCGLETRLEQCLLHLSPIEISNCMHHEDVALSCTSSNPGRLRYGMGVQFTYH